MRSVRRCPPTWAWIAAATSWLELDDQAAALASGEAAGTVKTAARRRRELHVVGRESQEAEYAARG